jgi:hypothetical protein
MDEYIDLIDWLQMLNKNPRYKLQDDNMKPIGQAYTYINEMGLILENGQQKFVAESLEIEKDLFEQIKNLNNSLADVEGQVAEFKDNEMIRKAPKYSE